MTNSDKTNSTGKNEREDLLDDADKWENRELGADRQHARRAPEGRSEEIDEKLGLKMISIRLQEELIEEFKEFAEHDGIGYQPLIRQVLNRYVHDRHNSTRRPLGSEGGPHAEA